jgi:hypothetical protein
MWLVALLACERGEQGPQARVKVQDSTPAHSTPGPTHSAAEVVHTGTLPALHTGEPCGAAGGLGWQVLEWQEETVADLEVSPSGSAAVIGRLLVPFGEALDVCSATCSEPWALVLLGRPGEHCTDRPATLPLLDVEEGEEVHVCVAVYEPGADSDTTCEITAGEWAQSFHVTAYCADC